MDKQIELDIVKNSSRQLMLAAKQLLFAPESNPNKNKPPRGWDKEKWEIIMNMEYLSRLEHAKEYIQREIDRETYLIEYNKDL